MGSAARLYRFNRSADLYRSDGDAVQISQLAGFFRVVYTTRALRRFRSDPVPDDVLFQLLDAAIRAASGRNAQDWRFVLVTDATIKQQMQAAAAQGWNRYQPRYAENPALLDQLPRTQRLSLKATVHLAYRLADVPVIVIACGLRGRHSTPGGSIFPAVQNLLLTARALGLGASIFNLALTPDLTQSLGIPEDYQAYCAIPIGYPADRQGPVRRKPVKQVTFWNHWGRAWEFAESQPDDGWQAKWLS